MDFHSDLVWSSSFYLDILSTYNRLTVVLHIELLCICLQEGRLPKSLVSFFQSETSVSLFVHRPTLVLPFRREEERDGEREIDKAT